MSTFDESFWESLSKIFEDHPDLSGELNIEEILTEFTDEAAARIKADLRKSTKSMLKERRSSSKAFERRNRKRWASAFDTLETHIVMCTEVGEEFNEKHRRKAVIDGDLVFDLVVRHHARACQIAQEILCLLKSGFADAAHARWRALHEVAATAMFIAKHGQDCAERFYFHEVVDSYDGMMEHKKYEDRLQEKAPTQEEIDRCKEEYDVLLERYGARFGEHYGWAAYLFPNHRRVGFAAIEKDVGLDHMRPYYKWASQNIHSGSKGMRNRLGLCEAKDDVLLVGQSNSGMTDPGHATAISLSQITCNLLMLDSTIDSMIVMKIIADSHEQVGKAFLEGDARTGP